MGEFLRTKVGKAVFVLFSLLVAIALFTAVKHVYAASVTGRFTGYAMGNLNGAFGTEVTYGHFANHPSWSQCYEGWPYNTRIDTPQAVTMYNPGGTSMQYTRFYLRDRGDPGCAMPAYWVDLYFGRSRFSGQPCDCPGSPSPGVCYDGQRNNCSDAVNFGSPTWTYVYTIP